MRSKIVVVASRERDGLGWESPVGVPPFGFRIEMRLLDT